MCHNILNSAIFLETLHDYDVQSAQETQSKGCFYCKCPLDVANYPRKPRGIPTDIAQRHSLCRRLSFCCRQCRKRHTPLSVIFLGRRVYLGAVIVLASALAQGLTPARSLKLQDLGLSRQTLHRWLDWWRNEFMRSPTWQHLQAHFPGMCRIPIAPLIALQQPTLPEQIILWLRHIKPISVLTSMFLRVSKITQNL